MRGVPFIEGAHDFRIATGGIRVFPRLAPAGEALDGFNAGPPLESGIKELDELMGGQIPWGFRVMIVDPPGVGKSSLAAQFAVSPGTERRSACTSSRRVPLFFGDAAGV